MLYKILTFIVLFLVSKISYAKTLESAFNEVYESETKGEMCTAKNKAMVQMTNKIEGITETITLDVKKVTTYESLSLKPTRCCVKDYGESNLFISIQSIKSKKEIFKGWIFAKKNSVNSLKDAKYDINLVRCL